MFSHMSVHMSVHTGGAGGVLTQGMYFSQVQMEGTTCPQTDDRSMVAQARTVWGTACQYRRAELVLMLQGTLSYNHQVYTGYHLQGLQLL